VEQVTHEHTVITPTDIEQHRAALCAWAEDNGIDPKTATMDPITIRPVGDRALIEYRAYLVDANGRWRMDPDHPHQALTVRCVAKLISPLAAHGLDAGDLGR
jgi:predicted exporter